MKRFTGFSAVAVLAMALAAMPVCAQPRGGGGGSRGGGGGYSGGGGGRSSSMSAPSRSGGSYGGGSSRSYSSGSSSRSYSAPSRSSGSYGGSSSRSYSSPSRSSGSTYSAPQQRQRSSGSYSAPQQRQQQPRSGYSAPQQRQGGSAVRGSGAPAQQRQNGARVAPNNGVNRSSQPSRVYGQPQTRSQANVPHGGAVRGQAGQPQRSIQGQPQRGMTPSGRPAPGVQHAPGGQPERVQLHHNGGPGYGPNGGRIAPRHRDPMPFNRPAPFWGHGHHYFGYPVHYLPGRYHIHRYWGRDYYIIDGLYYRHYLDYYYVCRPPFGVFFDPILDDIAFAACNIAYYASVYNTFSTINENANTITAQNQVIAQNNATIAQQNEMIAQSAERAAAAQLAADNAGLVQSYADATTEYFYDDGVFFVKDKSGKYVTVVPPAGAMVKELPEDYDTITLDGKEYYKVDDTVFRTTVVDGAVYFEVLGQMTGELADQFDFNKQ